VEFQIVVQSIKFGEGWSEMAQMKAECVKVKMQKK
jgi:uncharacterized protein (DUF736 family)